jgi:hypothetical protein
MMWRGYQVIFRLRSPLHIGWGKVGNLQRTRPYVTGRVLWGALTMRLTRDRANGRATAIDSRDYERVGREVHQSLAYTYFYPATKSRDSYQVAWPWLDENSFRRRFLSSYSGTALSYPHQSAATGMLHEVEFISPNALDAGESVFLVGYAFERDGSNLTWQAAFRRLQLGGERGYGWGDVALIDANEFESGHLFGGKATFKGGDDLPVIHLLASEQTPGRLLAHTLATNLLAAGEVEPLVGRETGADGRFGVQISDPRVCYAPGSKVKEGCRFRIGHYGVWEAIA